MLAAIAHALRTTWERRGWLSREGAMKSVEAQIREAASLVDFIAVSEALPKRDRLVRPQDLIVLKVFTRLQRAARHRQFS